MSFLGRFVRPTIARSTTPPRLGQQLSITTELQQRLAVVQPRLLSSCSRQYSPRRRSSSRHTQHHNLARAPSQHSNREGREGHDDRPNFEWRNFEWRKVAYKMIESSATAGASIILLGLVGYSYTKYYDNMVLSNMERSIKHPDPLLELATGRTTAFTTTTEEVKERWIPRQEQEKIDRILWGEDRGRYHLIMGEKGTGKGSMIMDGMSKIDGDGVVMMEAHADPEIFRIRLGRCLNFQFHEDNIGALFSIRGPRDASALLDIERAFNRIEQAALARRLKTGRPLVLIINSAHLIRDDDNGRNLIELIQQRAEQWAAAMIVTFVICTDKYWVYERLKQYSSRMEVINVKDFSREQAMIALQNYRRKYWREETPNYILEEVYDKIGGRLTFLNRVARATDMLALCDRICADEKVLFLSECAILGSEMDDDVMDQQKYAAAAMVLANHLYKVHIDAHTTYSMSHGYTMPQVPLHSARYVMTRVDFIRQLHNSGILSIDRNTMISASSVPMQRAFNEICAEPGFETFLKATLDRINEIESLKRTRELTMKDLWNDGKYSIMMLDKDGQHERTSVVTRVPESNDDKDEEDHDDT